MKYFIIAIILICAIESPGQVIQLLEGYTKECYADSTFTGSEFVKTKYGGKYSKTVWVHREPTFKGFIKFCKGKEPKFIIQPPVIDTLIWIDAEVKIKEHNSSQT